MQKNESRLTVYYEGPYWVGVYERISEGKLEVCKITFGAEPKDYEVYEFLLKNWSRLRFSPTVEAEGRQERKLNPKRRQRMVRKQLKSCGTGTKSQQALKLQKEGMKLVQKRRSREEKEEEKQRQFNLKQKKRKEKHRGK